MVTPEIDWWIKNCTQVKNPVYNKKQFAQSDGFGNVVTDINQDENIVLVLITDALISFCGVDRDGDCAAKTANLFDNSLNKIVYSFYRGLGPTFATVYINNIYYIQEGERVNLSAGTPFLQTKCTIGYISVSQKT